MNRINPLDPTIKPDFKRTTISSVDDTMGRIDRLNIKDGRGQLVKHLRLFPDLLKSRQRFEKLQFEDSFGRDRDIVGAEIISLDVDLLYNTVLDCDITEDDYIWFNEYVNQI